MRFIAFPEQNQYEGQLGGKAAALAALRQTDLPIPAWFVLLPAAFEASLNQGEVFNSGDAGKTRLAQCQLRPAVTAELAQALAKLCPEGQLVAVRSSAPEEDGPHFSFAGQLDSFLDVPHDEVPEKVAAVWHSAFSERLLAYRREHGLTLPPRPPAVLIQRMVRATAAGVAFSADPVSGRRDWAVIAAVPGSGQGLVSGAVNAHTYHLDRQGRPVKQELPLALEGSRGANGHSATPAPAPLSEAQLQAVAELARRVEQFFGCPQDIEWAIEGEQLYLLQARPITGLPTPAGGSPAPDEGVLNLWDNSNIAESYPGVTTPLTFSFARRAYEEVYRQFCRLMGVPAGTIAENHLTFRRMLGLMQGRIYYNLLSWYRVLAMLPGYKLNRRFMEQMMGVKESLPDELLDQQAPPSRGARLKDGLFLARTLIGLIFNYVFLPRRIAAFYARLDGALGPGRPDLSHARPEALVAYYRDLEQQLLPHWDAPLVNDFFAMIFYGLLRRLAETWTGDRNGTLQNQLLAQTGGIISAEPAHHLRRLAGLAAADPIFANLLRSGAPAEIEAYLPRLPEFERHYRHYLERFGDRCLEELKLESATLVDDPLPLFRAVGLLAQQPRPQGAAASPEASLRQEAEARVKAALASSPWRRWLFAWVLNNARRLVRNRENLRFERTRLFGRARAIFVALGQRFYELGWLADPRDIFYLEVEEALGLVEGTVTTMNLQALVALRRAEFEAYRARPPLPNRFETRGVPYQVFKGGEDQLQGQLAASPPSPTSELQGLGCSPGRVRGPVRIVTQPKGVQLTPGEILVAERTDPGWIMLFPAAAGLLVEYGSLLSHSAIVSRELGLPAVVSLAGVTRWLEDGDWVEFDGTTGVVTKVEPPDA